MTYQTNKKKLIFWNDGFKTLKNHSLISSLIRKKSNNILEFLNGINFLYFEILQPFYKIIHKTIGYDHFDESEENFIFVPFMDYEFLIYFIKNFPKDIEDFAKQKNIKIILCYMRETIDLWEAQMFDSIYKDHISRNPFLKNNVKILINSIKIDYSEYSDIFICINSFKYYHRCSNKVIESPTFENKLYDFSMMVGTLNQRFERFFLLNKVLKNNLLDDRFFYTIIGVDKDKTRESILSKIQNDEYLNYMKMSDQLENDFFENEEFFLQDKTYNADGSILNKDQNIYDDLIENFPPVQVKQSLINIVLETRPTIPSITEKMYKPISLGMPFLWFADRFMKHHLMSLGYQMYPFIDYSFDTLLDPYDRIDALVEEIKRLRNLGFDNLLQKVKQYKDISIYNQNVFKESTDNFDEFYLKLKNA